MSNILFYLGIVRSGVSRCGAGLGGWVDCCSRRQCGRCTVGWQNIGVGGRCSWDGRLGRWVVGGRHCGWDWGHVGRTGSYPGQVFVVGDKAGLKNLQGSRRWRGVSGGRDNICRAECVVDGGWRNSGTLRGNPQVRTRHSGAWDWGSRCTLGAELWAAD